MPARSHKQSFRFTFTWFGYTSDTIAALASLYPSEVKYLVFGEEVCPSTSRAHLQGYVVFRKRRSLPSANKYLRESRMDYANGSSISNKVYCSKDAAYYEFGRCPDNDFFAANVQRAVSNVVFKDKWDHAWDSACAGNLMAIPAKIRIQYLTTFERLAREHRHDNVPDRNALWNFWIVGESGSGKSSGARDHFVSLGMSIFKKSKMVGWDGYNDHDVVIIDDVSKFHVKMADEFKELSDHYSFFGNAKYAGRQIRPLVVVVTSRYQIDEIWEDYHTREDLNRRFTVIQMPTDLEVALRLPTPVKREPRLALQRARSASLRADQNRVPRDFLVLDNALGEPEDLFCDEVLPTLVLDDDVTRECVYREDLDSSMAGGFVLPCPALCSH